MDDSHANASPPPELKVKVSDTDTLTHEEGALEAGTSEQSQQEPHRAKRIEWLQFGLLALLAVVLIGAAAWWLAGRQGEGDKGNMSEGASEVPNGAVALINSSTPISLDPPNSLKEDVANLDYRPESEGWTPALHEAHRAMIEGRHSAAVSQYAALVGSNQPQEAKDALWGLASAYASSGQYDLAVRTYSLFSQLDDPRAARALARIGEVYERWGKNKEAAEAYGEYAKLKSQARHAIQLRQARLLGNSANAEKIYDEVISEKPLDIDLRQALAGLAQLKMGTGKHAEAKKLFDRLSALEEDSPRPVLDNEGIPPQVLAAGEAVVMGDRVAARKTLTDCIEKSKYPYGRYLALNALIKLDPTLVVSGTMPPMKAARIAYEAGFYGQAITFMDNLRSIVPDSPERAEAALLTGKAFELSGDPASAYNWYTATVQTYPTSPQAPEAMRRAGDALEEQAAWDAALAVYRDRLARYPGASSETALMQVHAAVLAYRLGQTEAALEFVPSALVTGELTPTIKTQAAFWRGKLLKSKGDPAWKESFDVVLKLSPGAYLDFRAKSLLAGEPGGGPLAPTMSESGVESGELGVRFDSEEAEQIGLIAWASSLSGATSIITATPSVGLSITAQPSSIDSDPETMRAVALLKIGLRDDAFRSFRALAERMSIDGDATGLARLMTYARYHADTQTSMRVAERLSDMDGTGDPTKRPTLLLKTLYPTPYRELVVEEATTRDIDPLVMYALMRQESQFVPQAQSHADARGLTQVIPSTGGGIADQLDDTSYSVEDLFLPHVSIRYGTYYMASNLPQFERKLLPALAAYNGGPGNAERWLAGSALVDPDLYIERIDLFETEDYLRRVYSNYGFYRLIYRK
ncbi:MAG: transglycosylase SLT domain-containing protein [Chloroflexia bacterium]